MASQISPDSLPGLPGDANFWAFREPSFPGHQHTRVACSKRREVTELAIGPCAIKTGQNVTFGTHYCYKLMTVSPWHIVRMTQT